MTNLVIVLSIVSGAFNAVDQNLCGTIFNVGMMIAFAIMSNKE